MLFRDFTRFLGKRGGKMNAPGRLSFPQIQFFSGLGDSSWLLFGLARSLKPKVAVEIGAARGMSACYIGMALKSIGEGRLYSIDPHVQTDWNDAESVNTLEIMTSNLEAFAVLSFVQIIRETSVGAAATWHLPIDLLFIDGDHSYEGVRRDWQLFVPHMTRFGVVIFHDTLWDIRGPNKWSRADMGVPRFVDELRQQGYPVVTIAQDCGLSIVQPVIHGAELTR